MIRKLGQSVMARGVKTGGGSRKGIPNKASAALKEMILGALDDAGGQQYLAQQAKASPVAFLALIGRVLPIQQQHAGSDGGPLLIEHAVVDRPPNETREQWLERRNRELAST